MRFEDDELAVVVQEDEIVVAYNRPARRAIVQIPDAETIPPGERDTRLRYAFQLALGAHGRSMIHAAVVGRRRPRGPGARAQRVGEVDAFGGLRPRGDGVLRRRLRDSRT